MSPPAPAPRAHSEGFQRPARFVASLCSIGEATTADRLKPSGNKRKGTWRKEAVPRTVSTKLSRGPQMKHQLLRLVSPHPFLSKRNISSQLNQRIVSPVPILKSFSLDVGRAASTSSSLMSHRRDHALLICYMVGSLRSGQSLIHDFCGELPLCFQDPFSAPGSPSRALDVHL